MNRKYWTSEEDKYIKEHISTQTFFEMAKHFKLDKEQVRSRARYLGLKSKEARGWFWKPEEDEILRQHYPYAPLNYLKKLLPNRSRNAMNLRAKKVLNISRKTSDRYYIDYNFFDEWNNDMAYFLGFILADGHLYYNKNSYENYLIIDISERDIDILEKLKSLTHFEGIIQHPHKSYEYEIKGKKIIVKPNVRIQINNTKIVEDIIRHGIQPGCKTYTAVYPKVPKKYQKDFTRGLIDGDGYLSFNPSLPEFSLGLLGTRDVVAGALKTYNVDTSHINVVHSDKNVWQVILRNKKAFKVAKWLYEGAHTYLNRKFNIYQQAKEFYT